MAPQRLRQIKREIRVLGVAVGRNQTGSTIVGAVYRGSLWLDGVLRAHNQDTDATQAIADMIADSPHAGQIRVILLSRDRLDGATVSTPELHAKTGKPVIMLGENRGTTFMWKNGGEDVAFSAEGLGRWSAEGVLKASTREGVTPEALRVAALTLSAIHGGPDA
ncbi:TPA: DUF99 family protein [Candidatus Bathyarchaeota archaeon]|nr:DUF99 family protein [Candidatus Bathyarchaeota archaeon]